MMKYSSQEPSSGDGGNYIVKAVNGVGEKECTLALNFGGGAEDEENISIFREKYFTTWKYFRRMCQPGSTSSLCYYNPTLQLSYWRLIYTPILNQRWI